MHIHWAHQKINLAGSCSSNKRVWAFLYYCLKQDWSNVRIFIFIYYYSLISNRKNFIFWLNCVLNVSFDTILMGNSPVSNCRLILKADLLRQELAAKKHFQIGFESPSHTFKLSVSACSCCFLPPKLHWVSSCARQFVWCAVSGEYPAFRRAVPHIHKPLSPDGTHLN